MNHDIGAAAPWNGSLDEQQLAGFIDANNHQILRGTRHITHVASHALARKDSTRILVHADRAGFVV